MFSKDKKNLIIISIITAGIFAAAWFLGLKTILNEIELITYDWRTQISVDGGPFSKKFAPADKDIMLLSADDYSAKKFSDYPQLGIGRWPFSRATWGDVLDFVSKGNPKSVVFDIKFEGLTDAQSDNYFSQKLSQHKNLTNLGISLDAPKEGLDRAIVMNKRISQDKLDIAISDKENKLIKYALPQNLLLSPNDEAIKKDNELLSNITYFRHAGIPDIFLNNTHSLGAINLLSDGLIARNNVPIYRLPYKGEIKYLPSLPLAAVLGTLSEKEKTPFVINENSITIGKRIIPINEKGRIYLNWHGKSIIPTEGEFKRTYNNISVADIIMTLHNDKIPVNSDFQHVSPDVFKDKIVVIGQTSAGSDVHPTPMGMEYPGPEIIATSIDNYLNDADTTNHSRRKFVTKASFALNFALLLAFCGVIGFFNIKSKSSYLSIFVFLFLTILFILTSLILFAHPAIRIWVNMTYPLIFMTLTAIGTYIYKINSINKSKKEIENMFGKFVSPQVLNKLLSNPKAIIRENKRKEISVLFSDIRGFTTISENTDANELVSQLNEYFNKMVEIVLDNEGTFDKFIGDAVMAFYGEPLDVENHAFKAIKTAIEMQEALAELNQKWKSEGKVEFKIGLGIHTGEVIVGYMGSEQIVDYTVLGDNVNLASRLEGLNKEYKTSIIISEETYNYVKDQIDAVYLDDVKVKGKEHSVKIYEVKGYLSNK